VATILGFSSFNQVRVSYYEGSSVYGSAPYDDLAQSAAVMSQLAGKPVRLQFMRWDEHGYDNYGPAMMYDIRLGADANGKLIASDVTEFAPPYYSTTPAMALTGTTQQVFGQSISADTNNVGTQYNLANTRVIGKTVPLQDNYFKISFLRGPQAPQTCFAYEQAIDELAKAANMDPYTFRLNNHRDPRERPGPRPRRPHVGPVAEGAHDRSGKMSSWKPKVAASNLQSGQYRQPAAASRSARTRARWSPRSPTSRSTRRRARSPSTTSTSPRTRASRNTPGGVQNQAEGSIVQGASRALFEQVTFNKSNVTSLDWVTYPIMRFKDTPKIHFQYVQRTDIPATQAGRCRRTERPRRRARWRRAALYSSGSGEPPISCIGAAIANAFYDATGVRSARRR